MLHALIIEPFGEIAGDIAGSIVGEQLRLMNDRRLIAA
jgi:hypothetical protein